MGQSSVDGFGRTTFDIEPSKLSPDVSDDIQRALSMLLAWDTVNHRWQGVTVNQDGAILTTSAAPQIQAPRYGSIVIPVAAGIIFNVNLLRRQLIIEMTTGAPVWLGFDSGLTSANGFQCGPGTFFSIDNYTGVVWGISPFGAQFGRYIES